MNAATCNRLKVDGEVPKQLDYVMGLANLTTTGDDMRMCPFDLVPSERQLTRYLNIYKQFKIKWIKMTWVPTNKGRPVKVQQADAEVTGAYSVYQPQHNPQAWLYWNWNSSQIQTSYTDIDEEHKLTSTGTTNIELYQEQNKKIMKRSMFKTWSIAFKPRVLDAKVLTSQCRYRSATTGQAGGFITYYYPRWKRLGWEYVITPDTVVAATGWQNTVAPDSADMKSLAMRKIINTPKMSIRAPQDDGGTAGGWYGYTNYITNRGVENIHLEGRWIVESCWCFRGLKDSNAGQIYSFSEAGGLLDAMGQSADGA